ncbi:transposable element Tc1 transposase [Trichonephila clavipes]|nr:transposable element Tc1 transposase [Trichonephila clavipes]
MNSRRETSENERALVIKWSKDGKSLREIASLIGKSHGCIQKYHRTGCGANIPGRGHKEILSGTAKREIIRSVKKNPLFNAPKLASSISSDGQYKVWRQIGKELDPKNTLKTVKYGGRDPSLFGGQDNDPKHTAKIVKLYLLYHCKKELHTPLQSPDLNVIENLCSQLEKSTHEHVITNKEDLKNVLKEEWTQITVETIKKLVESMPKRTVTAGSDVVQSGRSIFDDFFQHLWPYIGNNTANVVFQMVKRLWLIRIDQ